MFEREREKRRGTGMTRTSAEVGGVPGARTQKATQPAGSGVGGNWVGPMRSEKSADKCEAVSVI